MSEQTANPVDPEQSLKRSIGNVAGEAAPPTQPIFPEDSAVTKAEKNEKNGVNGKGEHLEGQEPATKRIKMEDQVDSAENGAEDKKVDSRDKVKGIALVKTESVSSLHLAAPSSTY